MQSPTAKMMLTEDKGSNVVPQKCKAPITSINVKATQQKTIKHILVSPSSRKVIENTQANASPKFLHNSNPEKKRLYLQGNIVWHYNGIIFRIEFDISYLCYIHYLLSQQFPMFDIHG